MRANLFFQYQQRQRQQYTHISHHTQHTQASSHNRYIHFLIKFVHHSSHTHANGTQLYGQLPDLSRRRRHYRRCQFHAHLLTALINHNCKCIRKTDPLPKAQVFYWCSFSLPLSHALSFSLPPFSRSLMFAPFNFGSNCIENM